jgi:hypothetical protein
MKSNAKTMSYPSQDSNKQAFLEQYEDSIYANFITS